ncbi:hypothetical protein A6V36_18080 [Paraburkholderia ginsengiterrae]|uniref:HTH gntR-type domain-containing protein n=1 Tax=Paraburkholderia ginsengiterrae TaxID=1462993 RepID=A0A1A9MYK8_9BURK|nr:hypothetical protein A6V37_10260 [Paraburkholderia ginsengiterrae]OAJ63403.1 hypothetical protein A6V36_18080 [Paraburkholderia ginsengiterrae]
MRDRIYDAVRELVGQGVFVPGQRLTEEDLAARFDVSRTPVREALFQLAREGLLVRTVRGYGVPSIAMPEVAQRLQVRCLVDPELARVVVSTADAEQLLELVACIEFARGLLSEGTGQSLAGAFHRLQKCLIRCCSNAVLARCCDAIEDDFVAARRGLFERPWSRDLAAEHLDRLLRAIQLRDADSAACETRVLIEGLLRQIGSCTTGEGAEHKIVSSFARETGN